MKSKTTTLLFLLSLLVIIPLSAIENKALTYDVDISQDPLQVFENDIVTITVTVSNLQQSDQIRYAKLSYYLNNVLQSSVNPEATLVNNEVVFKLGTFQAGDVIRYQVFLEFYLSTSTDYYSEYYSFTISSGNAPLSVTWHYAVIGVSCVLGLALITWIGVRRGYFSFKKFW